MSQFLKEVMALHPATRGAVFIALGAAIIFVGRIVFRRHVFQQESTASNGRRRVDRTALLGLICAIGFIVLGFADWVVNTLLWLTIIE